MKEKIMDRLFMFIEQNGGVYTVAETIEVSPQNFYTMKRRGSLPNLSLIYSLKEHYPSLNVDWLMFGDKNKEEESAVVADLKRQLKRYEAVVDSLTGKTEGVSNHPLADREEGNSILMASIGYNKRKTNYALLRTTMRFISPN